MQKIDDDQSNQANLNRAREAGLKIIGKIIDVFFLYEYSAFSSISFFLIYIMLRTFVYVNLFI